MGFLIGPPYLGQKLHLISDLHEELVKSTQKGVEAEDVVKLISYLKSSELLMLDKHLVLSDPDLYEEYKSNNYELDQVWLDLEQDEAKIPRSPENRMKA